jgi:DNA-damage-inducible protein J
MNIRLLMLRIADEHRPPFEVKVPDVRTRKAITELKSGKGWPSGSGGAWLTDRKWVHLAL